MVRKIWLGFPILIVLVLMHSQISVAATINAASCSQTDVQSAINSANGGDTVIVPAGTCAYTTTTAMTPSVTINKAITVQGATVCTGRANTLSCTDNTIINDRTGTQFEENPFDLAVSNSRLTGITIVDTRGIVDNGPYVEAVKDTSGWRVDHIDIKSNIGGTGTGSGVQAEGTGLIDHVYVQNVGTAFPALGTSSQDAKYQGDYSWTQPVSPGSANEVYIEDNELNYSQAVLNGQDDYAGARFVFRYNDVKGTNIGDHGLDSGGLRGAVLAEVYNNTFSNAGTHISQWWVARAGTYLIFNNTINSNGGSYDTFLDLRNYRSDSSYPSSWGACDGLNPLDLNTSAMQGWPCKDEIGRGQNQTASPAYSWGNNWKGSAPTLANINICGYSDCTRAQTYHILNNREFYNELPNFNGAAGVGSGLLSARPSTCAPVVGYWATDTNTLYKCTSANTWTAYYTPYTYPHPLQNAGSAPATPPAPTGLSAVAN